MLVASPCSHEDFDKKKVMVKGGISQRESAILSKFFGECASLEMPVVEEPMQVKPPPKKRKRPTKAERAAKAQQAAQRVFSSEVTTCEPANLIDMIISYESREWYDSGKSMQRHRFLPSGALNCDPPVKKRSAIQMALETPNHYETYVASNQGGPASRLPPLTLPPLRTPDMSPPMSNIPTYVESPWACASAWPEPSKCNNIPSYYEETHKVQPLTDTKKPLKDVVNTHDPSPRDSRRRHSAGNTNDAVYATIDDVSDEQAAVIRASASLSAGPLFHLPDVSKPPLISKPGCVKRAAVSSAPPAVSNFDRDAASPSGTFPAGRNQYEPAVRNPYAAPAVRNPYPPAVESPAASYSIPTSPAALYSIPTAALNQDAFDFRQRPPSRDNFSAGTNYPAVSNGFIPCILEDNDIPEFIDKLVSWNQAPLPLLTYEDCEFLS